MATTGARAVGSTDRRRSEAKSGKDGKSLAQWACLIGGPLLILFGLIGLLTDHTFDTYKTDASPLNFVNGDRFLSFEINGWGNVLHIALGLLLLLGAVKHGLAKTACLIAGLAYGAASVVGLIDGKDVFGLMPANGPDTLLWGVLAAVLLVAALLSTKNKDKGRNDHGATDRGRVAHETEPRPFQTSRTNDREVVAPASGNGRTDPARRPASARRN